MKEDEARHIAVVDTFNMAAKRIQKLNKKLIEVDRDKKNVEAALQAEGQRRQLWQTEDQLTAFNEQIAVLKKKLEEAKKARDQAKQKGYDVGVAKTEGALKAEVSKVCRRYCL